MRFFLGPAKKLCLAYFDSLESPRFVTRFACSARLSQQDITMKLYIFALLSACCACAATPGASLTSLDAAPPPPAPDTMRIPDAATRPAFIVIIRGQSNAHGEGHPAQLPLGVDDPLAQPFPAVQFTAVYGNDGEPTTRWTYPLGDLSPTCGAGSGEIGLGSGSNSGSGVLTAGSGASCTFGIELSLGRELTAARPDVNWIIGKYTADSTAIGGEWWPWGVFEPNGATPDPWADNLFELSEQWEHQLLQQTAATLVADIWIQGEDDALGLIMGRLYGRHLAGWKAADDYSWRTGVGSGAPVPFIYGRLSASFEGGTAAGGSAVRTGQEQDQYLGTMVDQDPYPLSTSDHAHFSTEGYVGLGSAYATAVLNALQ